MKPPPSMYNLCIFCNRIFQALSFLFFSEKLGEFISSNLEEIDSLFLTRTLNSICEINSIPLKIKDTITISI